MLHVETIIPILEMPLKALHSQNLFHEVTDQFKPSTFLNVWSDTGIVREFFD